LFDPAQEFEAEPDGEDEVEFEAVSVLEPESEVEFEAVSVLDSESV